VECANVDARGDEALQREVAPGTTGVKGMK